MRKLLKHKSSLLFVALLIAVAGLYAYQNIVFYQPQSIHKWRQSDCASLALNYYQGGMQFFKPEVHNLTSKGGTSGLAYTSEMPFLYYGVALLYQVFGPHDFIYRLLNTLIFLIGIFYLFRLIKLVTNNWVWSVLLSLLFFTSPVLVYYGNNFLTNSTELAFSLIGWYYFTEFLFTKKSRSLFTSLIIFFFAASFKITGLLSLFAIGTVFLVEWLGLQKFGANKKLFTRPVPTFITMFLIVFTLLAWVVYARIQNTQNECYYFSTVTFPIWDLDKAGIQNVLTKIRTVWFNQYFHPSVWAFLLVLLAFTVVHFKHLPAFVKWILLTLTVEIVLFILLQFWTFGDHDYYVIGLYTLPIILCLAALYLLKTNYPKLFNSSILKTGVLALLAFNVYYAKGEIYQRYHGWWNDKDKFADIYSIQPRLRQMGVSAADTIISIPDNSHATLYLMNQKGWTEYVDKQFNKGETVYYNSDSATLATSINCGAKYLILNGIAQLYEKPYLKSYCFDTLGTYREVYVFKLRSADTNFVLPQLRANRIFFCDAENTTADGAYFSNDSVLFEYGSTQSSDFAFSGTYSSKLNVDFPYGMTIRFTTVKRGETFKANVWRKNLPGAEGHLLASLAGTNLSNYKVLETSEQGWELLELTIYINDKYAGNELILYLHNPAKSAAYFDNLEIIRYQSIFNE
ncbi:MAG: ArnT family glycosyltransferase [Salinivirgaceae bacterium]